MGKRACKEKRLNTKTVEHQYKSLHRIKCIDILTTGIAAKKSVVVTATVLVDYHKDCKLHSTIRTE